jgi:3-oxoacyl-[acyl-carrier-protein] synthase II
MLKVRVEGVGWINSSGSGSGKTGLFQAGGDGPLPKLSRKDISSAPFPRLGRMDVYSRLGVSAISLALRDAGLLEWKELREIAVVASTVSGCLSLDSDYYDTAMADEGRLASPNLFAYSLANTYLGEAAIQFGLGGPGFVLYESRLTGLPALSAALRGIGRGEYGTALAGVCDAGPPPSFPAAKGIIPGAVFFVLRSAASSSGPSYGTLKVEGGAGIFFEGEKVQDLKALAGMCTPFRC